MEFVITICANSKCSQMKQMRCRQAVCINLLLYVCIVSNTVVEIVVSRDCLLCFMVKVKFVLQLLNSIISCCASFVLLPICVI
jgi:hypothetical protein